MDMQFVFLCSLMILCHVAVGSIEKTSSSSGPLTTLFEDEVDSGNFTKGSEESDVIRKNGDVGFDIESPTDGTVEEIAPKSEDTEEELDGIHGTVDTAGEKTATDIESPTDEDDEKLGQEELEEAPETVGTTGNKTASGIESSTDEDDEELDWEELEEADEAVDTTGNKTASGIESPTDEDDEELGQEELEEAPETVDTTGNKTSSGIDSPTDDDDDDDFDHEDSAGTPDIIEALGKAKIEDAAESNPMSDSDAVIIDEKQPKSRIKKRSPFIEMSGRRRIVQIPASAFHPFTRRRIIDIRVGPSYFTRRRSFYFPHRRRYIDLTRRRAFDFTRRRYNDFSRRRFIDFSRRRFFGK